MRELLLRVGLHGVQVGQRQARLDHQLVQARALISSTAVPGCSRHQASSSSPPGVTKSAAAWPGGRRAGGAGVHSSRVTRSSSSKVVSPRQTAASAISRSDFVPRARPRP
jgi:hypothetical protein